MTLNGGPAGDTRQGVPECVWGAPSEAEGGGDTTPLVTRVREAIQTALPHLLIGKPGEGGRLVLRRWLVRY